MQLQCDLLDRVAFLTGDSAKAQSLPTTPALTPFDKDIMSFLNDVSRVIMKDPRSKVYPDVVTFGFWIRKASLANLKERFQKDGLHLGKGVAFHIAPSNVPVNFAYSLAAGLLCGNANVVRVPSKAFPQVEIITDAFNKALDTHDDMRSYVFCVRYDRDREINDLFSSFADIRVIWGGDRTIEELRKSPLPPRGGDITFSDRYSLALIDSDSYLMAEDKERIAEDFYNDTFLSDQNACTSPRIIVWMGDSIAEAKTVFWEKEHELAKQKYTFQAIQGVNKLTTSLLIAAEEPGVRVEHHDDNLIVRVKVPEISSKLMDYRDNSGYFYEYDCKDIMDIAPVCNDKRCQTVSFFGDKDIFLPLIRSGVKGIDRIVPIGRTMDFDLIWDGYDLTALLTRNIVMI